MARTVAPSQFFNRFVTMKTVSQSLFAGLSLALALHLGAQTPPPPAGDPALGTPAPLTPPPTAPVPDSTLPPPPAPLETNAPVAPLEPAARETQAKPAAPKKKPAAPRLPKGHFNLRGTVKSSDTNAMSLTVTAKSKDHVLRFDGQSRAERNGEPVVFRSIQAGDTFQGEVRKGSKGAEILVHGHFKAPKAPVAP